MTWFDMWMVHVHHAVNPNMSRGKGSAEKHVLIKKPPVNSDAIWNKI